jgi:outer membrane protein assembly factor BamB
MVLRHNLKKICPFLSVICVLIYKRQEQESMITKCEDIRAEIELYVLGAADKMKSRLIEEHLSKCTDCRQIERQYKLILTKLRCQKGYSEADSELIMKIQSVTKLPLKRAYMRKHFRRLTATAALMLTAFVWEIWSSHIANNNESSNSQSKTHLMPATTVWHKANAVGLGFSNADEFIVDKGTVFFLTANNGTPVVTAVNSDSGRTKWQSDLASCGYLETDGARLYCVAFANRAKTNLAALDMQSGQVQWTFETTTMPNKLLQPTKATILNNEHICWISDNIVYLLNATNGREIWRQIFEGESTLSRVAAVGGSIYTVGRNGIYCIDTESGRIRWHMPRRYYTWPGTKPMVVAAGSDSLFVAAGSRDGRSLIQHINTSAQRCLWERLVPRITHIYADSVNVYVRCRDVLALDQATGKSVWNVRADGCSQITGYDDMICFIDRTREGRLVAVTRNTGREIWQVPGLQSCNAFVRVGKRGYLKTNDNIILAFAFDS